MRSESPFQVKPVVGYDLARYPSHRGDEPAAGERERMPISPSLVLLLTLLVLGLSFGFVGCFVDYRTDPCSVSEQQGGPDNPCGPGPDPDPDPDPDPTCLPGAMACRENAVLAVCDAAGETWNTQACEDYCDQMYGLDAYTTGCDVEASDPCGCEYDIIDGDIAECTPGDFYCVDDQNVSLCNEDRWSWDQKTCNDYCQETYGPEYHSYGCDSDAEAPCDCQYDVLDGMIGECDPGQFYCQDESTLMVCADDRYSWDARDCQVLCEADYGEDYYTAGCDASDADNPCGCEYGIVDGEPVEP